LRSGRGLRLLSDSYDFQWKVRKRADVLFVIDSTSMTRFVFHWMKLCVLDVPNIGKHNQNLDSAMCRIVCQEPLDIFQLLSHTLQKFSEQSPGRKVQKTITAVA
jgi:hypothetical protein